MYARKAKTHNSFLFKKKKINKEGTIPVHVRVTIDGLKDEIAIVKLRNCAEPSIYEHLDPHADFLGIDEESFTNTHFLEGGFLIGEDEVAQDNYIPITNIECIEVNRYFIFPDDRWQ